MTTEERLERLRRWLTELRADDGASPHSARSFVVEISINPSTTEPGRIVDAIRAGLASAWHQKSDHDLGQRKGIYVWFWPEEDGKKAWPLYVGKSQRGRSCFRSRTFVHLEHARRGVDYLYDRSASNKASVLENSHEAGDEPDAAEHGDRLLEQFDGMRILCFAMEDWDASDLAGDAEALMLAAVLRMHGVANSGDRDDPAWKKVMNSFGRTVSMSSLTNLVEDAVEVLSEGLAREPRRF